MEVNETLQKSPDGAISRGMPVPDQILEAVIEAISNHELSIGLDEEVIKAIGVEAVHEGTLDDNNWLEEKLIAYRSGELSLDLPNVENLEAKISSFEEELAQIKITEPLLIESQEQLSEVVRQHEIWMESVLNPSKDSAGSRANFEGMTLSGLNLSNVNLSCANFRNAVLLGTNFSGANLSRSTFESADVQGADFSGAKLRKVNFENAQLDEIDIDNADIKGANFTGTIFEGKTIVTSKTDGSEDSPTQVDPFMMI